MLLEKWDHGLSTRVRGGDDPGRRRSMARSKDKSKDKKSIDGQAFLTLPDMTVSPMEFIYPNDHLEDHEGDRHVTRPDNGIEITDHASIPTGNTPAKMPPQDHSYILYDERPSIDPKADTERKKPVVGVKQDSVRSIPKCYNCSAQLVQVKQPPYHYEEEGTVGASSSTPQSQDLFIDTSLWFLLFHTVLNLLDSIVTI